MVDAFRDVKGVCEAFVGTFSAVEPEVLRRAKLGSATVVRRMWQALFEAVVWLTARQQLTHDDAVALRLRHHPLRDFTSEPLNARDVWFVQCCLWQLKFPVKHLYDTPLPPAEGSASPPPTSPSSAPSPARVEPVVPAVDARVQLLALAWVMAHAHLLELPPSTTTPPPPHGEPPHAATPTPAVAPRRRHGSAPAADAPSLAAVVAALGRTQLHLRLAAGHRRSLATLRRRMVALQRVASGRPLAVGPRLLTPDDVHVLACGDGGARRAHSLQAAVDARRHAHRLTKHVTVFHEWMVDACRRVSADVEAGVGSGVPAVPAQAPAGAAPPSPPPAGAGDAAAEVAALKEAAAGVAGELARLAPVFTPLRDTWKALRRGVPADTFATHCGRTFAAEAATLRAAHPPVDDVFVPFSAPPPPAAAVVDGGGASGAGAGAGPGAGAEAHASDQGAAAGDAPEEVTRLTQQLHAAQLQAHTRLTDLLSPLLKFGALDVWGMQPPSSPAAAP